jgi:hypothetical protein
VKDSGLSVMALRVLFLRSVEELRTALNVDSVVLGGGNVKKIKTRCLTKEFLK